MAAFFAPVQIALTGIAAPAGWFEEAFDYNRLLLLVSHPISRLYLFALISMPLFHWAHRFRFTVFELGFKRGRRAVAVICYGAATVGMILAAIVLLKF